KLLLNATDRTVPTECVHVLVPHNHAKGTEFTARQVLESMSVSVVRTKVEITHRHDVKSAGVGHEQSNNELSVEELRIETAVARSNRRRLTSSGRRAPVFEKY